MSKMNIQTAKKSKKSRFDVSSTHITTLDVGQARPTNILPLIPGDKVTGDYAQFSRLSALVAPTFGSFQLKTYMFFVPHRVVWRGFESYMARSVDTTVYNEPKTFYFGDLLRLLFYVYIVNENGSYKLTIQPSSNDYCGEWEDCPLNANKDFIFTSYGTGVSTQTMGCNLTSKGRWVVNTLRSLGYEIPSIINATSQESLKAVASITYDAMPLLSFARCFYDYIYPSQYVQQQGFAFLFESDDQPDSSTWLPKLMDLLFVPYEQDFFTSLWLHPNAVSTASGASSFGGRVVTDPISLNSGTMDVHANNNDTFVSTTEYTGSADAPVTMSAYAQRWMQALSDFVVRNNIGGTRFHEWMRSHFGFVTQEQDANRSKFIKSWSDDIQISDVTAYTAADGQRLGDQAGKGTISSNGKFMFEAKEHGYLIFISLVVPRIGYYQGTKPWVHEITSPFDFYTPELDSVGLEPVPFADVYSSYDNENGPTRVPYQNAQNVFGFAPRYASRYKISHDYLTGDFRLRSRNVGLESYHTMRALDDKTERNGRIALDARFMSVGNQYNRIFAADPTDGSNSSLYDKIFTIFRFNVTKYANMLTIGESMPIFDKKGENVTLDYQGTQLN